MIVSLKTCKLLGYNTKDPILRKFTKMPTWSLLCLINGGTFGHTLDLETECSNTLLQSNLASPWLRLDAK